MSHDLYQNPLITRYASPEMSQLWSPQKKFSTWRRLWVSLAEAERELGIDITQQQIDQMRAAVDDIDFDNARRHESRLRHDVMAHVHAFGDICPDAQGKIHLGATSCFVTDNTDLLLLREGLQMVAARLADVIFKLADFAAKYRDLPTLGFTHLQPAQPVTVGKRACLWAYDFVLDLHEIEHRLETLAARSVKGASGTQASFLNLFNGDGAKVKQLEQLVAEKMGFEQVYAVTGQTYPRKIDSQVLDALSGVAQSAHKSASDVRILAHRKELEEPFGASQIGSSAMPYKRNPMKCERVCSLSRFVISLQSSPAATLATQWMERTLDDSANRRLTIPQAFLAIDSILMLWQQVASDMVVYPEMIKKNLMAELPFMATENIMMAATAAGGDRQVLHERIRLHSKAAADAIKLQGASNDLLQRLKEDPAFAGVNVDGALEPSQYVGRSPQQVDEFIADVVAPLRGRYTSSPEANVEV